MAVFSNIAVPAGGAPITAALTNASSAEIVLGKNCMFAINCDNDMFIRFGVSGMAAASASYFRVPANQTLYFDTGSEFTAVRIFCAGTAKNYYIQKLSR